MTSPIAPSTKELIERLSVAIKRGDDSDNDGRECCYAPWTCCDPQLLKDALAALQSRAKRPTEEDEPTPEMLNAMVSAHSARVGDTLGSMYARMYRAARAVAPALRPSRGEGDGPPPTFTHSHVLGFFQLYTSERREIAEWLSVSREQPDENDVTYSNRVLAAAKDAGKLGELARRIDVFHAARCASPPSPKAAKEGE